MVSHAWDGWYNDYFHHFNPPPPMPTPDCPPATTLTAFHQGSLADPAADAVAAHVEGCARCEAALEDLDADEPHLVADLRRTTPAPGPAPREGAGTVVGGRYKLVEPLGEGGMGSVWMAQQTEPVRRPVAVKLIKPGMDSRQVLARFEAERQALALMDHPNIARVLDAGATDRGRPFFVMELVKGVPITRYCDEHKLTPRERLELFVPVCQAVQHAHQKGIIHRDLKPGNVLVARYDDKPVPKVIDFGVAKAAGQPLTDRTLMTGFGSVIGTPEYMSPEQATFNALDVDTRTDVYALGVLLYELLTGATPLGREELAAGGLLEILRVVREQEPPRPSTKLSTAATLPAIAAARSTEPRKLAGLVRGELDWIVMRALEKDRSRRYQTANSLAADVERYLGGEPVHAAPPSAAYRARKFARRYRGPVSVVALVLFALVAGVIGTTAGLVQAQRDRLVAERLQLEAVGQAERAGVAEKLAEVERDEARRARDLAEQSRLAAQELASFIYQDILSQADVRQQANWLEVVDPDLTLREAMRRAAARIGQRTSLTNRSETLIRWAVGDSLVGVGEPAEGIPHLERALSLMEADPNYGPQHKETLFGMHKLNEALRAAGRLKEALAVAEKAVELTKTPYFQALPGDEGNVLYRNDVAQTLLDLGRPEPAVRQLEDAAAWAARDPVNPELVDIVQANLADAYRVAGRSAEARRILESVLLHERARADEPWAARLHFALGRVALDGKDWAAAEGHFRASLVTRRRREPKQWTTFATAALLGQALAGQKKFADAEAFLLDGYQGMTARAAAVSPRYKTLLAEVADLLAARATERGDAAGAAKWRAERAAYPLENCPAPRLVR